MEKYRYQIKKNIVVLFLTLFVILPVNANKNYSIYIDADFTGTRTASLSIQQGINVALAEENHLINGYQFKVIAKDHKGNSLRSKRNLEHVSLLIAMHYWCFLDYIHHHYLQIKIL